MKRITHYVLIAVMAANLAACGGEAVSTVETTEAAAVSLTEPIDTIPVSPVEEKNYEGREFRVITHPYNGVEWTLHEVYSEGENGEILNDKIFERNLYLQEKYDINIVVTNKTNFLDEVQQTVLAQDDAYDLALPGLDKAFTWSASGYLTEVSDIQHLNLDQPWWNQSILTDTSINNKNYILLGSHNLLAYDSVGVLFFNKGLLDKYNIEAPYEAVHDGKWTFDNMIALCLDVSTDLDGNNLFDEKDAYGLGINSYGALTFSYGAGASFTEKDKDDLPYFKLDEKFVAFFQKFVTAINEGNAVMYGEDYGTNRITYIKNAFEEGRMLFYNEMFNRTSMLREMEMDFGLVPMPKADELQDGYRNFIHQSNSSVTCIPATVTDYDFVGRILEDMAYYSHYHVYPAYIDTAIKSKYLRDEESAEMADIILNSIVFDFALTTSSPIIGQLRTMLTNNDTNIASTFASIKDSCEAKLAVAVEGYLD